MAKTATKNVLLRLSPELRSWVEEYRGDVPLNTSIVRILEEKRDSLAAAGPVSQVFQRRNGQ